MLRQITIPYFPHQVVLDHIQFDGKLLAQKDIENMLARLPRINHIDAKNPVVKRYDKATLNELGLNAKYSLLQIDNDLFAIYYGAKHNSLLGSGSFGAVKLAQNLKTGEWVAIKIIAGNAVEKEYAALKKAEQGIALFGHINKKKIYTSQLVMRLAHGNSLSEVDDLVKNFSLEQRLQLLISLLEAYQTLLQKGVYLEDRESENTMIDTECDKVSAVDFGEHRFFDKLQSDYFEQLYLKSAARLLGGFVLIDATTEINKLISKMYHDTRSLTLFSARQKLNELKTQCTAEQRKPIGILDISEYSNAPNKKNFLAQYRKFDLLQLRDTHERELKFYLALKRELNRYKFNVSHQINICPPDYTHAKNMYQVRV